MYSLDCEYFDNEYESLEELIEGVLGCGMDPSYQITFNGQMTGETLADLLIE